MKKNYIKPIAEIITFQSKQAIMSDEEVIGGGGNGGNIVIGGESVPDTW